MAVLPDVGYVPYDPAGYVARLEFIDPELGEVVRQAIRQASQCLYGGTLWAATIMLGVASEALVRDLIAATANAMRDEGRRTKFLQETKVSNISRAFQHLERVLGSIRPEMSPELPDGLDTTLTGVFGIVRLSRNEAGHPRTLPTVDSATVHSRLVLFIEYVRYIRALKNWLAASPLV